MNKTAGFTILLRLIILLLVLLSMACSSIDDKKLQILTSKYQLPVNYTQHGQQQSFLTIDDKKIAYTDHGTGEVLVLFHGVPTSSWLYRKIIPLLQENYRIITVDFLGYGSSEKPKSNGVNYQAKSQARRVAELLEALKIKEFSMLMHDMGGLVAWELLRSHGSSIANMIILNTIVHPEGFHPPDMKPGMMTKAMTIALSSKLTSSVALDMTFKNLGLSGSHQLSEAECRGYVKPLREGSNSALYAFYTGLDEDLFTRLKDNQQLFESYTGQSLVLWGGKDEVLTTAQIPFLQKYLRIPEQNIHIYPNNNHFLVEEMPEEIVKKIIDFL